MSAVSVTELLYANAAERADAEAVVHHGERVTWGELVDQVERLARGLAANGIRAGDAVALVLRDDPWYVASFHAVSALGAIVVPVNPAFKQAELEFVFRTGEVRCVIADERSAGVCERIAAALEGPVTVVATSDAHGQSLTIDALVEGPPADRLAPRDPDETFVYQFSSGSTGRPKRVPRTHGQCAAEAALYASLGMTAEDRIFSAIPLFHTWGQGACLLAPAATGATVVILEDPNPFLLQRHRALELLERERATIFPGVPFQFRLLAEAPDGADLSALRLCFSAGTALPRETFEAFGEKYGVLVRQLYGATEAGVIAANMDPDPVATFESVGRPVGEIDVAIVDDDGQMVPAGEVGEVAFSSPALTDGYSNLDDVNRTAFRDGRFFTGDLGRLDAEGRLYIAGRKKLLLEVGGYKVDPIEVEDVLVAHPKVVEAVVVGVPGRADGEETVKAVVVPDDDCDDRELIRFCQERLANYKVPRIVEFRDEIPKSPLGKILRKYLV
ncbi:MAG: acyl--CoA ligase [Solirubrobacterales bacterium]|nr:acyl--CoA ligase [Solirubrobacterales bacterium]